MPARKVPSWTDEEVVGLRQLRKNGLRLGLEMQEPWAYPCGLQRNERSCNFPGFGIDFTRTLCDRVNVNCEFVSFNHTELFTPESDSQETFIQKIIYEEVDTALPLLMESNERREVVDFTMPLFFLEGGLMVRTRYTYGSDLFFVVKPFENSVWIALFFALAAVSIVDAFCRMLPRFRSSRDNCWRKLMKTCLGFIGDSWMYNLALFLQRGVNVSGERNPERLLQLTWGLISILVCGTYSAFLIAARAEFPFTNIKELAMAVGKRDFRLYIDSHSALFIQQIANAADGKFSLLKTALETNPPLYVRNYSGLVEKVLSTEENIAFYSSMYTLKALARSNCNLTLIPIDLVDMGAFAFRKTTIYAKIFTKLILNFKDKGYFLERLEQKYRFGRNCEEEFRKGKTFASDSNTVELKVGALRAVFGFVLLGGAFGGLLFGFELLYVRLKKPTLRNFVRSTVRVSVAPIRIEKVSPRWDGYRTEFVPIHAYHSIFTFRRRSF